MLQITNIDDTKPEWNMNETHIIIPMIDGDVIANKEPDKITNSTITLNTLDGGDQAVLTNGLEASLVIGLDRNLFETHNKSDLLVIQNPDLKLLSCNSDLKNSVAYTLSYVDQDRSEILWESPVLKDRIKHEWCSNDKTIFEVKDVLNYDDSVLEKSNEQINLDDVSRDLTSHVSKIDGEIFISVEEGIDEKKNDIQRDGHFIVNYYPAVQGCEMISLQPEKCTTKSKENESLPEEKSVSHEIFTSISFKNAQDGPLITPEHVMEEYGESVSSTFTQYETDEKNFVKPTKDDKNMTISVSSTLPEKSLPLKKKAKMKTTMALSESTKPEDITQQNNTNFAEQRPEGSNSDSNELMNAKIKKRKKVAKTKIGKPISSNNERSENVSLVSQSNHEEETNVLNSIDESNRPNDDQICTNFVRGNSLTFDERKVNSISDLVEELKRCRMINASVWQTLHSGLREMNIDILQEILSKRDEKPPAKSSSYSAQLKAFALVLYFKQPAAFNYLAKVYESGWPSLDVIKDWKRRINNHQRPNFVGAERETSKS